MTATLTCNACGTDVPVEGDTSTCPECGETYPTEGLGGATAVERPERRETVDATPATDWPMVVKLPWHPCGVPLNARLVYHQGRFHTADRWDEGLNHARTLVMAHAPTGKPDPEGLYRVGITLYRPDNRRRDVDGMAKLPLDALEGGVVEDDSQVRDLRVRDGGVDRENPRLVVTVEPLADVEAA